MTPSEGPGSDQLQDQLQVPMEGPVQGIAPDELELQGQEFATIETAVTPAEVAQLENVEELYELATYQVPKERLEGMGPELQKFTQALAQSTRHAAFEKLYEMARSDEQPNQALALLCDRVPKDGTFAMQTELCKVLTKHPECADTLMEMMGDWRHRETRNYAAHVLRSHIKVYPELGDRLLDFVEGTEQFPNPIKNHHMDDEAIATALLDSKTERATKYLGSIQQRNEDGSPGKVISNIALARKQMTAA